MGKRDKQIIINYRSYDSLDNLPLNWKELVLATIQANSNAYAPYSRFSVSAGILLNDQKMCFGANVENASYPVGACAERNVLNYVMTNRKEALIEAIAIFGQHQDTQSEQPISPCGMCRQAILETEVQQKKSISVILISSETKITIFESVKDLLPFAFDKLTR